MLQIPLSTRKLLWSRGLAGIDCAIRYAATELDLYLFTHALDIEYDSDESHRHYANFLAWSDTALAGMDKPIRAVASQTLVDEWLALAKHPLRIFMRNLRNEALKGKSEVIGFEFIDALSDGGYVFEDQFQFDPPAHLDHAPVLGTSFDYMNWILTDAGDLLMRAIDLGARGPDPRTEGEMPFDDTDPWTTRSSPELVRL